MHFKNEETNIQVAVVNYIKYKYPDVLLTIAPNGMKLPPWIAKMFKAMGYTAGTTDIIIFQARGGYHGFLLEIKTEEGTVSKSQKDFMNKADISGYFTCPSFGYDNAIKIIDSYFKMEITNVYRKQM